MTNYGGYAFKPNESELAAEIRKRYSELREQYGNGIEITKRHGYNRVSFTVTVPGDITEMDALILADDGNLCFGGSCSRNGDTFSGQYFTD